MLRHHLSAVAPNMDLSAQGFVTLFLTESDLTCDDRGGGEDVTRY